MKKITKKEAIAFIALAITCLLILGGALLFGILEIKGIKFSFLHVQLWFLSFIVSGGITMILFESLN